MTFPRITFRLRIALTLIAVIGLLSSALFYFYTISLSERIYKGKDSLIKSTLSLIKDELYFTISVHDGRIIQNVLKKMDENHKVLNTFLVNENGKITYPKNHTHLNKDSIALKNQTIETSEITIKKYNNHILPFSRAFIPLNNEHRCFKCHGYVKKNLGFIVIDISNEAVEKNLSFTRTFSFVFTLTMILVITFFVIILHYKFVRKSLSKFQESINKINAGNLNEQLIIPESEELGKLGKSFNEMVYKFKSAQEEIYKLHKKELESSKKMATIGEMASRLAHEIRNPMTGISNALDIIIEESNDSKNIEIFEEIKRQTNRVNNVVSDLLKFSKSKELNLKQGNITEIINKVIFFFEAQSQHNNILFEHKFDSRITEFNFDSDLLENVFINLIRNSIRAMNNKGNIVIETKYIVNQKIIQISFTDNGQGIAPDKLNLIFKPFFTTYTEGTGLGLSIVNEIIEKHNGNISVLSKLNEGSTFIISLPTDN